MNRIVPFFVLFSYIYSWCLLKQSASDGSITRIDYSPDRNLFATISPSGNIRIWNALNHMILAEINDAPNNPTDLAFSYNNSVLAVAYDNNKIRFYDTHSPYAQIVGFNPSHGNGDLYIDFSDSSDYLLTCGGNNNKAKVWSMSDLSNPDFSINSGDSIACEFDSASNILISLSNNKLDYYDSSGSQIWSNSYQSCIDLDISPGLTQVIAACKNGGTYQAKTVSIDGSTAVNLYTDSNTIKTASYAEDDATIFFGGEDNKGYFFDGASGHTSLMNYTFSSNVISSDFSVDSDYLLVGTDGGQVYEFAKLCLQCSSGQYLDIATKSCLNCAEFIRGCTMCINATYCTECTQGFYIDTTAHLCEPCQVMQGCGSCKSATQCIFCMSGYYLDNQVCQLCDVAMNGCLKCQSKTVCEKCTQDFYVDTNSKCASCRTIGGCSLCSSSTYCDSCQIGYFSTATGTCQVCGTNCLVCEDGTTCIDCRQGFYPHTVNGNCIPCGTGCLSCNETGYCIDCVNNMYPNSGSCSYCTFPCDQCDSAGCLMCTLGYFLDGTGNCQICDPPCATCNSSTDCLSCSVGHYLTTGDRCEPCELQHSFCEECTPTICLNCTLGYYLNTSNACTPCTENMYGCLTCTSQTSCLQCSPGNYLTTSSGNDSCKACPIGCSLCTDTTCQVCQPSYYLSSTSCLKCSDGCETCDSSSCYQCQQYYYLNSGACYLCSSVLNFCLTCDKQTASVECTSCAIGSFLSGTSCTKCSSHCDSCDSSTCFSCELGYYLFTGFCSICPQNCTTCLSPTNCTSCTIGFYLDVTNDICKHCSQINCLTCNSTQHCLSCFPGFYLSGIHKCQYCFDAIDNCEICNDSTICTICAQGYILAADSKSCISCSDNVEGCLDCSVANQCLICENGYFLHTSGVDIHTCGVCPKGCTTCDQSVCTGCAPSYVLDIGVCKQCQQALNGCQICSSLSNCNKCLNGYYLNGASCFLCRSKMKGCQFCDSDSICKYCAIGYYLSGNSCSQCELTMTGCQVCSSNSVCEMCEKGYFKSGSSCNLCQSFLDGCSSCENSSKCDICYQGYYLDVSIPASSKCKLCSVSIPGCISCQSSASCEQCTAGYYLESSDNKCYPCLNRGCEVCDEIDPNKCSNCNSHYFLNVDQCQYCKDSMQGCNECLSGSACSKCQNGYFMNSSSLCQLCSSQIKGCSQCAQINSIFQCIQCKSSYFLDSITGQCKSCFDNIIGCAYCFNDLTCENCAAGYYLDSTTSVCESCRTIDGCLVCSNSTNCILCKGDYFLQTNEHKCYPCNVLEGCYSCSQNTTCKVCVGGYILNDDKKCQIMAVSGGENVKGIKFQSSYENQSVLTHQLLANQLQYNTDVNFSISEWNQFSEITLQYPNFTLQKLSITEVQFISKNQLKFSTNNPLNISREQLPTRRLLTVLPEGYKTYCQINQQEINQLLPSLYMSKSLVMDYDLSESNFVKTFTKEDSSSVFSLIGIILVLVLTIQYIIKATKTCTLLPYTEHGQLLPHILALKAPIFVLYPLFPEQINYYFGYMVAQFPWAIWYFSDALADKSEKIPFQYEILYSNMGLGTTYMIPLALYTLSLVGMWFYYMNSVKDKKKQKQEEKQFDVKKLELLPNWPLKTVFYNFFLFGLVFNCSASLQSAILNPIEILSVSSVFTILGIVFLVLCVLDCLVSLIVNVENFYKTRILIKAVVLSVCHFSPLYIFCSSIAVDFILMVIEYRLTSDHKTHPKIWVFNNFLCIIVLAIAVLLHYHFVTLISVSVIVLFIICLELYVHYHQHKENIKRQRSVFNKGYEIKNMDRQQMHEENQNIWDIGYDGRDQMKESSIKAHEAMKSTFLQTPNKRQKSKPISAKKSESLESIKTKIEQENKNQFFIAGEFM